MSQEELFALLVLGTAGSFTPGPNTALSTALAANHGLRRALPFVCAVPCGWSILLVACSVGLGAAVQQMPPLRWVLLVIGASYLLWLAWRLARPVRPGAASTATWEVGFAQGVSLQFLNPKAWLLAVSVTSRWIIGFDDAMQRFFEVLPIFLFFAFSSNFTYACVGAALRDWLQGPAGTARRLQGFNRTMALALVGTVIWMVVSLEMQPT